MFTSFLIDFVISFSTCLVTFFGRGGLGGGDCDEDDGLGDGVGFFTFLRLTFLVIL